MLHQFETNARVAPDHMPVGYYWYFRPQFDPAAQAEYFCNLIKDKKFSLPPVLDLETDGEAAYNNDLSEQRAKAVRQMLIAEYDFILPSMLEAVGYGEERPLFDNDSAENKALNRRIEVVVWWEDLEEPAESQQEEEVLR